MRALLGLVVRACRCLVVAAPGAATPQEIVLLVLMKTYEEHRAGRQAAIIASSTNFPCQIRQINTFWPLQVEEMPAEDYWL
jgi:hypothetical protein